MLCLRLCYVAFCSFQKKQRPKNDTNETGTRFLSALLSACAELCHMITKLMQHSLKLRLIMSEVSYIKRYKPKICRVFFPLFSLAMCVVSSINYTKINRRGLLFKS